MVYDFVTVNLLLMSVNISLNIEFSLSLVTGLMLLDLCYFIYLHQAFVRYIGNWISFTTHGDMKAVNSPNLSTIVSVHTPLDSLHFSSNYWLSETLAVEIGLMSKSTRLLHH